MAAELILYTNPMSRGRIARWMLEEVGVPYRTEWLDFGTTMKSPEYLAINPMGKVPTVRHGSAVVTECAAICAYLADAFPEAGLAPPPADRASYYRWLFFAAGPLEACLTARSLGLEAPEDKRGTVGYGHYGAVLDALEAALEAASADGGYLAGGRFSAADLYVGSHVGWGLQFGTLEKRPVFSDYFARVSDRDARRRADEIDDAAAAQTAQNA